MLTGQFALQHPYLATLIVISMFVLIGYIFKKMYDLL